MTTLLLVVALVLGGATHNAAQAAPAASDAKPRADDAPAPADRDEPAEPEEWVAEYVEYRCLPELGHITISDGVVRGRRSVEYLRTRGKELAARGIFHCTDDTRRRS